MLASRKSVSGPGRGLKHLLVLVGGHDEVVHRQAHLFGVESGEHIPKVARGDGEHHPGARLLLCRRSDLARFKGRPQVIKSTRISPAWHF